MIQIIQRRGRTILFSSHVLGDVERVADRVGVLVDGVLRVDCPAEHFKRSVRKIVAEFGREPPPAPACRGLLSCWQVGTRLELVFVGYGPYKGRQSKACARAASKCRVEPGRCLHRVHARAAAGAACFYRRTDRWLRRTSR